VRLLLDTHTLDRLLVVQAQLERLALVTRDPTFRAYEVEVRW